MIFCAIGMAIWVTMWYYILILSPICGFYADMSEDKILFITVIHLVSLVCFVIFFVRHAGDRKKIILTTKDQKMFLVVGVVAAVANFGKNYYTDSFRSNLYYIMTCGLQNTVGYLALVFLILIADRVNFKTASKLLTRSFWTIWICQALITLCVFIEGILYLIWKDRTGGTGVTIVSTLFRSYLLYFGRQKLRYARRKYTRPDASIFEKVRSYNLVNESFVVEDK